MANVKFVLDADEAKAVNAFLRVVDSQKKVERQFDRVNKKITNQGKGFESLGKKAVIALGALAIPTSVFAALSSYKTELDSIVTQMDSLASKRMINSTVGDGKGVEEKQARAFAVGAGITPEQYASGVAHDTVFQIRSLFKDSEKDAAVKAVTRAASFVRDPANLASGMGKWVANFGHEGDDMNTVANKIFMLASESETDAGSFGFEMAKFMKGAKNVGARSDYAGAALAIGSQGNATTSTTADRLKALTTDMIKLEIKGETMEEKYHNMKKSGITPKNYLKKATGSTEAMEGYQVLFENEKAIGTLAAKARSQKAIAGTDQSFIGQRIAERNSTASMGLPFLKNQLNTATAINKEDSLETMHHQAFETAMSAVRSQLSGDQTGGIVARDLSVKLIAGVLAHMPGISPAGAGKMVYSAVAARGRDGSAVPEPYVGQGMGFSGGEGSTVTEIPEKLLSVLKGIEELLKTPANQKKMNPNVHGE